MNQEELVKRLQIKDIMAFERLYDMYWENICGVVNTIVRDKYLAEEISQNVFVQVWNNSHNYNLSKGRFFSWVLNIARKAAIEEVLSKSYEDDKNNASADYFLSILDDTNADIPLIDSIGFKKLAKDLKKKYIQIVDLIYFKGYTPKETSETLNIPLRMVKTRNRNCIFQLRENMTLEFEWM